MKKLNSNSSPFSARKFLSMYPKHKCDIAVAKK